MICYYAMNDDTREEILCNTNFSNLKIAGEISMNYEDYAGGVEDSGFSRRLVLMLKKEGGFVNVQTI